MTFQSGLKQKIKKTFAGLSEVSRSGGGMAQKRINSHVKKWFRSAFVPIQQKNEVTLSITNLTI